MKMNGIIIQLKIQPKQTGSNQNEDRHGNADDKKQGPVKTLYFHNAVL